MINYRNTKLFYLFFSLIILIFLLLMITTIPFYEKTLRNIFVGSCYIEMNNKKNYLLNTVNVSNKLSLENIEFNSLSCRTNISIKIIDDIIYLIASPKINLDNFNIKIKVKNLAIENETNEELINNNNYNMKENILWDTYEFLTNVSALRAICNTNLENSDVNLIKNLSNYLYYSINKYYYEQNTLLKDACYEVMNCNIPILKEIIDKEFLNYCHK